MQYLGWCGPGGQGLPEVKPPAEADETIATPEGYVETDWLSETLPRVGLRTEELRYINFAFFLSGPLSEAQVTVPLRAKISADEQREDLPEVVVEHVVQIRHGRPG